MSGCFLRLSRVLALQAVGTGTLDMSADSGTSFGPAFIEVHLVD
jgi:hypothetical protein